ncbi:hypothetical protein B0H34DRAFT_646827 [Crassisporium funariophilum]|nr:hypothetical protein B0H34DRAFT_646827 [Crassisporium funariophilum]
MLSSWFGPKSNEEQPGEGVSSRTTPRPSISSPTEATQPQRVSVDKLSKRAFPTAFSTPHDAILVELQGSRPNAIDVAIPSASRVASPDVDSLGPQDKAGSRTDVNFFNGTPTPSIQGHQPSRLTSSDLLLDPFDGTSLGVLIPLDPESDEHSPSQLNGPDGVPASNPNAAAGELVWSHLSRVLDLQSQISKMHTDMEGIGTSKPEDAKKKHRASHKGMPARTGGYGSGPDDPLLPPGLRDRKRGMSTVSTVSSSDEPEGDEEGVNVLNEEAEKNRAREAEFESLANQFEGRKEAIHEIMGKLDDLSKVLSDFHALQAPNIDFPASRNNSLGVASFPASGMSPAMGGDSDVRSNIGSSRTPMSQSSAPTSNRTYEWAQHTAASTSMAALPPGLTRTKSETVTIGPPPQRVAPSKKVVPTLLVNSMEPGTQSHVMDSPASTLGSLKLPPED